MALSAKRRAFIEQYLRDFNAKQAAIRAGYSPRSAPVTAHRIMAHPEVQEAIKARLAELKMGTDEVLLRLAEQARGDLGVFFKVSERWTEEPLPTQEIIDEKEAADKDGNPIRFYLVRQVCLDTERLTDPRYSHLVKKFSDSPKYGLTVELYDAQSALQLLGRSMGMFIDKTALTDPSGTKEYRPVSDDGYSQALSSLADALREELSRAGTEPDSVVGAAEQASVAGAAKSG